MDEYQIRDWNDAVDREAWLDFVEGSGRGHLMTSVDASLDGLQFYLGRDGPRIAATPCESINQFVR